MLSILYCYAECHVFYIIKMNVIMLNVLAPNVNNSCVAYSDIHLILFLFSAEIILQNFLFILLFVKPLILFNKPALFQFVQFVWVMTKSPLT